MIPFSPEFFDRILSDFRAFITREPARRGPNVSDRQIEFEIGVIPGDIGTIDQAMDYLLETLLVVHQDATTYQSASQKVAAPTDPSVTLAVRSALRGAALAGCIRGKLDTIHPEDASPTASQALIDDALTLLTGIRTHLLESTDE